MLKRKFAVVLTSALALGGGTAAWAATGSGGTDSGRSATHKQVDPAKSAAVKDCFSASGVVKGQEPTDTQRQALKTCLRGLGITWDSHHGHDDATADPAKKAAAADCVSSSGVVKGQEPTDTQRQALKTCLAAAGITKDDHHDSGHHHGSGHEDPPPVSP